jgi:hypothetical protein
LASTKIGTAGASASSPLHRHDHAHTELARLGRQRGQGADPAGCRSGIGRPLEDVDDERRWTMQDTKKEARKCGFCNASNNANNKQCIQCGREL